VIINTIALKKKYVFWNPIDEYIFPAIEEKIPTALCLAKLKASK
jgi:hypothetical protein